MGRAPHRCTPLTDRQKAEIRLLASEGWTQSAIRTATGHAVSTIRRHADDLLARAPKREPDLARWGRLLRAVAESDYRDRAGIARRFGYANRKSLSVSLVMAKRRLAQAERSREGEVHRG